MSHHTVRSEISGKVWKIEKKVGDTVEAEEPIVILESMKMEIPVSSERAGRVVEILVQEEDPVDEDQPVAVIDLR